MLDIIRLQLIMTELYLIYYFCKDYGSYFSYSPLYLHFSNNEQIGNLKRTEETYDS